MSHMALIREARTRGYVVQRTPTLREQVHRVLDATPDDVLVDRHSDKLLEKDLKM